jgi:hypothetical protein
MVRAMDQVHRIFPLKNKPQPKIQSSFAKIPLSFFVIKPQSTNFQEDPLIFKNNSRYSHSHFQKLQIGSYNFFLPYLRNNNSDFSDSCAKILRISSSFILCIHLHMFVTFY